MNKKANRIDKGTHYILSCDEKISRCISCGHPIEYSKKTHRGMHKCSAAHENRREAANRAAYETVPTRRVLTFGQRLAAGFNMVDPDFHF